MADRDPIEVTQADKDAVTDEMIEAALHAPVPGGSQVWAWLPQQDAWTPHQTARDVMRCALATMIHCSSTTPAAGEVEKLERWGFHWRGHDHGTHERMADGYWTPWHIAAATLASLQSELERWKLQSDDWQKRGWERGNECDKLQADLSAAQAELARVREAADQARVLIGAKNDMLNDAQTQSNINEAWHILTAALTSPRAVDEGSKG